MRYERYLRVFLWVYLPFFVLITWLAFTMERYSGDLTRIGGFLEKDFGWNKPQEKFAQPLFTNADSLSEYDRYYDVVVFGDSFSMNTEHGWQNYFVNGTGLSLITFHLGKVNINELIRSKQFQREPPRIFVVEKIENSFHSFLLYFEPPTNVKQLSPFSEKIEIRPLNQKTQLVLRNKKLALRMDEPIHYLKTNVNKMFGSYKAFRHSLTRNSLFSNSRSDEILIYYGDRWKAEVSSDELAKVERRLASLQKTVESNGRTFMVTMIAPDKSTAYRKFFPASDSIYPSIIARLPGNETIRIAPLEKMLRETIDLGVVDVYLPNDTHWGFEGHKTVAAAIQNIMSSF